MNHFSHLRSLLPAGSHVWLVTGVAGFIGSNLLEALLACDQRVVGLDNFATGHQRNLAQVEKLVTPEQWGRFSFIEGDISRIDDCRRVVSNVDFVLHQAALGSVPRSIDDPLLTHASNVTGFLNLLVAARDAGVKRFVYAASSSTYGDHPALPKIEHEIGAPLSPYAVTKYADELYADVFGRCYGMSSAGLRYFNVFGPRQDPDGAYAAVIPKWIAALLRGETVFINGDGETSRDFCFIDNVVQANLRAAVTALPSNHEVYNVAVGNRTSLNELFEALVTQLSALGVDVAGARPEYREFREGDVRHSLASIDKARRELGFEPTHTAARGLELAMKWYVDNAV